MLTEFSLVNYQAEADATLPAKRARLVCSRCHAKKIKCDLKNQQVSGSSEQCSNCVDAGCLCQLRPSKRGAGQRQVKRSGAKTPRPSSAPHDESNNDGPTGASITATAPAAAGAPGVALPSQPALQQPNLNPVDARCGVATTTQPNQYLSSSYMGDSGYMQIFGRDSDLITRACPSDVSPQVLPIDEIPPGLQESHLDSFFDYGFTWCPILDRKVFDSCPALNQSVLLKHALALCGNQIKPSLLEHGSSLEHYNRAKQIFYSNGEPYPLVQIIAIMLFYWWSAEPPNIVSLDTTWWWTGTAIRIAQQIGLHREPNGHESPLVAESTGLRRRLWWTLVARERITAASQGRPCLIDLEDCDVPLPTLGDFPNPDDRRAAVFVAWAPLCEIIGRVGKILRRKPGANSMVIPLARELKGWIQSLPPSLQPSILSSRTTGFDRDVHGLHLTYLSSITLLHLHRDARPIPEASIAAIVAASCTARIFQDYLLRGSVAFLAGQAGWYIAIAILALLHARNIDAFAANADTDIRILQAALKAMARQWHSSRVFQKSIDKLIASQHNGAPNHYRSVADADTSAASLSTAELCAVEGINWQDYFPYVSADTSPLIGELMASDKDSMQFPELFWTVGFPDYLNQFFTTPEDFTAEYLVPQ